LDEDLALLLREHLSDVIRPLTDKVGRLAENFRPLVSRHALPLLEALVSCCERRIELGLLCMRELGENGVVRGIDDVGRDAAVTRREFTVDIEAEILVHECSFQRSVSPRAGSSRLCRPADQAAYLGMSFRDCVCCFRQTPRTV